MKPAPILVKRMAEYFPPFAWFLVFVALILGVFINFSSDLRRKSTAYQGFSAEQFKKTRRLSTALNRVERINTRLESEIALLNHDIARELKQAYQYTYQRKYDRLSSIAGIKPWLGDGLEITLKDAPSQTSRSLSRLNENPNGGIVHNTDLVLAMNTLWSLGAQAVSINDQRILSGTAITCAGPIILINQTRMSPPFVLKVAGLKPEQIRRLDQRGSYFNYLKSYGISVDIAQKKVSIPGIS
ncbi:MAG: DUF881 domain-containing protein [Cyanobacteria bacterium]|nr:DUF881 domain-containing protein [Cyanobacteriota bacterium]